MNLVDLVPPAYRIGAALALAAALTGAGGCMGWAVNGWRLGARVADVKAAAAQDKANALAATVTQLKTATAERDKLAGQLAAVDNDGTETLRRLEHENDSLRGAVAAGSRVVRVRGAVCPAAADVPQAPAGSGVDSATGAVLTAEAGRAVFDFRADAGRVGAKLDACQAALRAIESPR